MTTSSDGPEYGLPPHAHSVEVAGTASDARYQALFDRAPIGILYADAESHYIDANACMCAMLGYARDELIGMHASDIVAPAEAPHIGEALREIHGDVEHRREWRFQRKDGTHFLADVVATKFDDGTLLGMVRDITTIREHEIEIDRITRLYDALSQINQSIVWSLDRGELFRKVCRVLVERGGLRMAWIGWHDPESHRLIPVAAFGDEKDYLGQVNLYADDRPEVGGLLGRIIRAGQTYVSNDMLNDPAALPRRAVHEHCGFHAAALLPIRLQGVLCATLCVYADRPGFFLDREVGLLEEAATDVSFALDNFVRDEARRETEQMLRDEKLFSDTMIESMPGLVYFYDTEGNFLRWNKNFETVSGYNAEEISRMHPIDFFAGDDKPLLEDRIAEVFSHGASSVEASFVARDGTTTPFFFTGQRIDFEGQIRLVGVGIDISERKQAEAEAARKNRLFQAVVEGTSDAVFVKDQDGKYLLLNEAAARAIGLPMESILGKDDEALFGAEDGRAIMENDRAVMAAAEPRTFEERFTVGSAQLTFHALKAPHRDDSGTVIGLVGVSRNITERLKLEDQLRQSQKMEAVGRLAAGVAHDFNNLLTVIAGHCALMLADPNVSEDDAESITAIQEAGDRASTLTRQLLGFSRQTMLQPKVLDLNAVVSETGAMLRRIIGEDIRFTLVLAPRSCRVKVDPGQLDQVLLNLAVNARDAMPQGGSLTIETAMVALGPEGVEALSEGDPGPHAVLSITDTGCGMDREVLDRIFEPFFTTKEVGQGTGLGLAMVFGIVKQSGGGIQVESEPGQGTTFRIYLPAIEQGEEEQSAAQRVPDLRGSETILVVEDDSGVRGLARRALEKYGYRVLLAADGREALDIARAHGGTLDLVLTDVVMPNMGGPELVAHLHALLPQVKVVFTSGYTDDTVVRHGLLAANVQFIQKPYRPVELVLKLRQVLDGE